MRKSSDGCSNSGSGIIENENRETPIPGVIQVASADVISRIFHADAKRQEEWLSG
jgi:hypothetical protein